MASVLCSLSCSFLISVGVLLNELLIAPPWLLKAGAAAYIQTCTRACTHAHAHTHMHAYMHACMHTYVHAYMRTCVHTYIRTYVYIYIYIYIYNVLYESYIRTCACGYPRVSDKW